MELKCYAAVSYTHLDVYKRQVLRAMDVSECPVVVPFSHSAEGNILYSADTLIVPATVAAFNGETVSYTHLSEPDVR